MKLPYMNSPCPDCPFTAKCMEGWLGEERIKEILSADTFVCHKRHDLQCAGHMIIKGDANTFVRLADRLGIPVALTGQDKVFNTEQECVEHHT